MGISITADQAWPEPAATGLSLAAVRRWLPAFAALALAGNLLFACAGGSTDSDSDSIMVAGVLGSNRAPARNSTSAHGSSGPAVTMPRGR